MRFSPLLALIVVCFELTSCTCSTDLDAARNVGSPDSPEIMVLNASADLRDASIAFGSLSAHVTNVTRSTEYMKLLPQSGGIAIRSGDELLVNQPAVARPRQSYTLILLDSTHQLQARLLENIAVADPAKAYVRFVNTLNQGKSYSNDLTIPSRSIQTFQLSFGRFSDWEAVAPGEVSVSSEQRYLSSPTGLTSSYTVQLVAGKRYTFYVLPVAGGFQLQDLAH